MIIEKLAEYDLQHCTYRGVKTWLYYKKCRLEDTEVGDLLWRLGYKAKKKVSKKIEKWVEQLR